LFFFTFIFHCFTLSSKLTFSENLAEHQKILSSILVCFSPSDRSHGYIFIFIYPLYAIQKVNLII